MARTIVGEIFLNTRAVDGGVSGDVQKIIDTASGKAGAAAAIPITANTAQAEQAVSELAGSIEGKIGGSWQAAAAEAAVFTATVLGVKAAVEGVVNKLSGLFDQLAQAQAGFSAILGSQSAGTRLLDDIREFARVSPFVTQELVNYSQQLLGVGQSAESIVPLLKNTGDLIASVGGDTQNISRVLFTLTQIRSIGRLVGQDAIQLQSSLVPITKLLADFLGKTTAEVKKLQEQGAISADTVFAAINNAGQKVEGAMATATRNISGARSVLSDTITIMAQDSQVLNKVFDDIVKGILNFSNALGENEKLQSDIAVIDEALTRLYDNIKPLIEAFGETSASLALDSLSILASSLELLADALDAIPAGVLELVGKGLAVLFALKAPFFLFRYVTSIQDLARGLKADLAANLNNTAAAMERTGRAGETASVGIGKYSLSLNKAISAASAAAFGIGLLTQSMGENNDAAQTLGSTLSTAAIGAQIGLAFGPGGAAVGAVAGGAIGMITSFVSNAREENERRQKEYEEMGAKAAAAFERGFALTTPEIDTRADFSKFLGDSAGLRDTVDAYDELIDRRDQLTKQITDLQLSGETVDEVLNPTGEGTRLNNILKEVNAEIDKTKESAESARSELKLLLTDSAFSEAATRLATTLSTLRKESEGYNTLIDKFLTRDNPTGGGIFDRDVMNAQIEDAVQRLTLFGDVIVGTEDQLQLLEDAAGDVGLSIEQFMTLPIEDLIAIMDGKLPSALTQARIEVQALATKFDEAKKATDEFFKPFSQQIATAQAALTAQASLGTATDKFLKEQTQGNALALGKAISDVAETVATANSAIFGNNAGNEAGVSFLIAQMDALRESLNLTTPEFEDLLRQMGLLQQYKTGIDPGFTGNINELSEAVGISRDKLRELIPSLEELDNRQEFTIPINVLDKLEELSTLTDGFTDLATHGQGTAQQIAQAFLDLDFAGGVIQQINDINSALTDLTNNPGGTVMGLPNMTAEEFRDLQVRAAIEETKRQNTNRDNERERARLAEEARLKAEEEAEKARKEAERLAEEQRREQERIAREAQRLAEEALREQERIAKAYKDANEALQGSLKSASDQIAQAADQWVTGIRARAQDEDATSIGRLLRNAGDQARNLDEINKGLLTLQGRGLSRDALDAIGVDSVTDIRQVRKLLQASPAQLAELSTLVATRDSNAEIIARRERQAETQATIVAAILQAAQILGVDLTPKQAEALALQVQVTGNGGELPANFIEQLLNGQLIVRG